MSAGQKRESASGVGAAHRPHHFISRRDGDAGGLAPDAQSVAKTLLDSGGGINYSPPMFDIVRPQIATAADKVSHLRRFL
jgi:hypothetical protein